MLYRDGILNYCCFSNGIGLDAIDIVTRTMIETTNQATLNINGKIKNATDESGYAKVWAKNILMSGAKLSFLTALDENADPVYDKALGQKLADEGAFVGAVTPDKLGDYIGRIMS